MTSTEADEHCASAFIEEIQVPHVVVKDLRLPLLIQLGLSYRLAEY